MREASDTFKKLGLSYMEEIEDGDVDPVLLDKVPLIFAKSNLVLPIKRVNGKVLVAVADQRGVLALNDLERLLHSPIIPAFTQKNHILDAIHRFYDRLSGSAQEVIEDLAGESLESLATEWEEPKDLLDLTDEAPIIRLLNSLLFQAAKERASDLHIEPYERVVEVRLRIDGVLYPILSIQKGIQEAIVSRVKVMSDLDIAEKRLPQDGRSRLLIAGKDIDVRVSIIPTSFGERVVMRLLDRKGGVIEFGQLGFSSQQIDALDSLLSRNSGIVLVTGPTGSGKTTTLYAALNRLNSTQRNIITVEDPVEYQLKGIGQVQINPKIGLTFAAGLRSILRQDPDVIMVGEIRDLDTAEIAIQASLTGHLVLSTLHTNDAATAIIRLIDMGIDGFLVVSSVSAVIAQRLVRSLCQLCKEEYVPTQEEIDIVKGNFKELWRPVGCKVCFNTGYYGRIGVSELLTVDEGMHQIILKNPDSARLREYAVSNGMRLLMDDGFEKVLSGITSLEEILRVTSIGL